MYCYPIVGAFIKLLLTSENTAVYKLMENENEYFILTNCQCNILHNIAKHITNKV